MGPLEPYRDPTTDKSLIRYWSGASLNSEEPKPPIWYITIYAAVSENDDIYREIFKVILGLRCRDHGKHTAMACTMYVLNLMPNAAQLRLFTDDGAIHGSAVLHNSKLFS